MSAGCAEMRKSCKIGGFINFGETGDEPNTFDFYFQHNITLDIRVEQQRPSAVRKLRSSWPKKPGGGLTVVSIPNILWKVRLEV